MPIPRFVLTWMPAKAELDAVRGRGLPPTNDCAAEDAALRSAPAP
jgi:hypothetical protein